MMKGTRIKICGLTKKEDVLFLGKLEVDYAGFIFVPGSPRCLDRSAAEELISCVPQGIKTVGVFADEKGAVIREVVEACRLDLLQFHGRELPDYCRQFGLPYFKVLRVKDRIELSLLTRYSPVAYLLDTFSAGRQGGTGKTFNWELARAAKKMGAPIILAGGLNPGNVFRAVREIRPWGVDVSSGVELRPGFKDHGKMKSLVETVRKADQGP